MPFSPACFYLSLPQRFAVLLAVVTLCVAGGRDAQILQGRWVDEAEASIETHRKTDVTVIVLDRNDRAVNGAAVELKQVRHDFVLGLTIPVDRLPPEQLSELPIYRCFNAIALDRVMSGAEEESNGDGRPDQVVLAWHRAIDPIRVDFGSVISADPARNNDKLSRLDPQDLRDAVLARVTFAIGVEPKPSHLDLYADFLNQDMIERKLGVGMVHRMFEHARAQRPEVKLGLRARNTISLQRGRALALAVQGLEVQQIPFDHVTIEQRFTGQVQAQPLKRALDVHVASLPVPVTLAGLEVGGPTDVAAGINMETLLRLAFAQPAIDGLIFAGLYDDELIEEHAALIDSDGKPTASGIVLDQLFQQHWISDVKAATDERGNANARVFTGWYEVTAKLPGGQIIKTDAYIPRDEHAKLIILQQTTAEE